RALELSGVMESVIALCASEREEEQLVAVEALIHAAGKAKRASFITANGVSLLKDLYKGSERDSIRIRALVGLCKLGSAGGTDFSMKQFAEGSTLKLAKQCRKWLCNDQIDAGTRRWAVEGPCLYCRELRLGDVHPIQACGLWASRRKDTTASSHAGSIIRACQQAHPANKFCG
ncbi:unc-45 homolog A (C. elegans), isoform CRA_b, partial [Mus musculus]